MKGKLTTKTVVISIVAILVLSLAVVGTVLFLKDSGIAKATVDEQNPIVDVGVNDDENLNLDNDNEQDGSAADEDSNAGTDSDSSNDGESEIGDVSGNAGTVNNNASSEEGPAPTTIERERVFETRTLGWGNIDLTGANTSLVINYNNLKYRVEYYFDGQIDDSLTETFSGVAKGDAINEYTDKITEGYKLEGVENYPLTISHNEANNVIKVKYVKDSFAYEVKYYKDSLDEANYITSEAGTAEFGSTITADTTIHIPTGYKFEGTAPSMVIAETGNVINVVYVKDSFNYEVRYYKDSVSTENYLANETGSAEFGSTITADTTIHIPTGYKFEGTAPSMVIAEAGNVINVVYVKDSFNYEVRYYKDSVSIENYLENETGSAEFGSTITADTTIHIPTGYKFEGTAPSMVIAETGNVINVVYVKNKYNYIVKHYYQGLNENEVFQDIINAPDETHEAYYGDVIAEQDIVKKAINGYVYKNAVTSESEEDTTLPLVVTENVAKNVISLYYVRDNFEYEIRYYHDSLDEANYITSETGSAMYGATITADTTIHRPTGYTFEGEAPSMVIAFEGNVINVVYVKAKYEYKVEYYFDGKIDNSLTVTKSATYGTKIETYDDKIKAGYKLEKTENLPLTISAVAAQNVIKVYYSKPNITIDKTVDATAKAGSELTYYIKLTNSGKVSGTVDVTDELPDEVEYVSSTDNGEYSETNHTVVWSDIKVNASSSKTLEVVVKLNADEIGTTISNTAKTSENKTSTVEKKVSELKSTVKECVEGEEIKDNVNIILVMDLSSSMNEKDATNANGNTDTRLNVAKAAAQDFIGDLFANELNKNATVSVITFNTKNTEYYWWGSAIPYTGTQQLGSTVTINNYSSLVTAIGNIDIGDETSGYGTHIGAAMDETLELIGTLKTSYPKNKNIVIFLGDGAPTTRYSNNDYDYITGVATTIKNGGADIYSIGFGNDITAGSTAESVLKGISTSGNILTSTDADGLSANFSNIADQIRNKEATSSSGKMTLELGNTLVLDDKNTIIVEYKGAKLFECTKAEDMPKYFLEYNENDKTLTWDINAWNAVEGNTKVVTDDINIIYYVEK